MASGIAKWLYRQISRFCCPWNVRFSQELKEPAFAPREVIGHKDARTLARELLGMTQEEFSAAFKGSPMKCAKLRGLKRNAAVVLGNIGTAADLDVLTRALDDAEPLVREHAAWAFGCLDDRSRTDAGACSSSTAAARGSFPGMFRHARTITIRGLRDAPDAGLSGPTTPAVRLALVETLTREAWALAGREVPTYARHEAPVHVRPLGASSRAARR